MRIMLQFRRRPEASDHVMPLNESTLVRRSRPALRLSPDNRLRGGQRTTGALLRYRRIALTNYSATGHRTA